MRDRTGTQLHVRATVTQALDALAAPFVHARVTRVRDHRPWPMPRRPWVMGQTWRELLFAHWDVAPATLRRAVPAQLELDTFDGRAWIAVTPFVVRNLRVRPTLPRPVVSGFPGINGPTSGTLDARPGIYFFSLDADSALAVAAARRAYRLPYFRAEMSAQCRNGDVSYASRRVGEEAPSPAAFRAGYRPIGQPFQAKRGSLEHWLTERYCLYTLDDQARPQRA